MALKLQWSIDYTSKDYKEYVLSTKEFTLFRLVVKNNIVVGIPIYPHIKDTKWYSDLLNKELEYAQDQIELSIEEQKMGKLKKLHLGKNIMRLISLPKGFEYYVSLKWSHDKDKRDLWLLKQYGYFTQTGRFSFKRTDKQLKNEHIDTTI